MKKWQDILPQHLRASVAEILQSLKKGLSEIHCVIQPGDIFVDLELAGTNSESVCWTSRLVIDQHAVDFLENPPATLNHSTGKIWFQESGLHEFMQGRRRMLIGVFPTREELLSASVVHAFEKLSISLGARAAIIIGPHWHKVIKSN